MEQSLLTFAGYVVDCDNEQLRLDHQPIRLTNKAFAVLRYLVERPRQLVTKDALVAAVWPETVVSETTLTNRIGELRRALGDDAKQPQFIETVQRRGYRFIGKGVRSQHSGVRREEENQRATGKGQQAKREASSLAPSLQSPLPVLVGREVELTQLRNLFIKAMKGERQVAFVTGEAGIGKTSLVDTFLAGLGQQATSSRQQESTDLPRPIPVARSPVPVPWISWGQCIEQYGAGEAYLPVLEALGRLGHGPHQAYLLSILNQYAPTWLVQLPALLSPAELEAVQRRIQGATRERMLREIVDAFDVLTAEYPLVIVLEDLHWSDPSTVELLAMLARRRERTRLFIVGTYRAAELSVTNHPLKTVKQELVARGQATEIPLNFLSPAAVREYVSQRMAASESTDPLAEVVYRRTDGQPFFMVQVTDYLVQLNGLTAQSAETITAVEQTLPHGLRELIEAQLGRLTEDEQSILAVSSVVGAEFPAASVAAAMAVGEAQIEAVCERLARRGQFLEERGVRTWPDGTMSACYTFRHALYQEVLYKRIPEARRGRLHQCIGEWEEQAYGERPHEIAAELVLHFERGRDKDRAALYLQQAGENALRRYAYPEALGYFHKGAEFLQALPQTTDRARHELALQFCLVQALAAVKGHASIEVERTYLYAQTLCEQVGSTQQLFFVLLGLFRLRHGHCKYRLARDLGAQCLALAQREHDPAFSLPAYYALGASELFLGNFVAAEKYLTQGVRCHDMRHDATYVALYGNASPYTSCHGYAATALWYLGYPDQAVQSMEAMLRFATEFTAPLTVAGAKGFAPLVYHCRRQGPHVQELAEDGIALSTQIGFPFWRAIGFFWRGWSLAEQGHYEEGIQQMQQGLAAQRATGSFVNRVHFSVLLAEAFGHAGQHEEGLRLLAEAEAEMERTDERFYEAELWRIKGELTLQQESQRSKGKSQKPVLSVVEGSKATDSRPQIPDPQAEAEGYFLKAIEVAHYQQAKSLELRAVMSLVRLRQLQALAHGSRNTDHATRTALVEAQMLSEVYSWFTEGFDTKDLQEAKALIEELSC